MPKYSAVIQLFKKGCHDQWLILGPKGTLGTVKMSDNAPVKVVTVWPCHYDEPALYILQFAMTVINYLCCLNPTVPFGSSIDYLL